ncbi:MAG: ribulose 1,5-bisphosphate carboxylase, partial [Bauldia litoralis]
MAGEMIRVTYRIETGGDPEAIATKIAADQSTGTFTELPGETEAVRARCAARVESLTMLEPAATPSLPDPDGRGPYHRADAVVAFPLEAV